MRGKTVAHTIIAVLSGIAVGGAVILAIGPSRFFGGLPPLPPPPVIDAERGAAPAGTIAFEEQIQAEDGRLTVGCGFLLALPNGDAIGVTTAHSLGLGNFSPITFEAAGHGFVAATFATPYAPLGQPRTGADMTVDYVLLNPDAPPDPSLVLQPDPRGAPQPGERVTLVSGLGDGRGAQRLLHGTVESIDENGAWVRMDDVFDPSGMSGSPMLSQHTGKVVGMIVVMNWVPGVVRVGMNPIRAIVQAAAR